jgi:hypothetical protein
MGYIATFIFLLVLPYLLLAFIAAGLIGGGAYAFAGLTNGRSGALAIGLVIVAISGGLTVFMAYWASTPPSANGGKLSLHQIVFETYRSRTVRSPAMRMFEDGTIQRITAEKRRADAARAAAERQDKEPGPRDERK